MADGRFVINYASLALELRGQSLGASLPFELANSLMPVSYQHPNGRWLHDDHAIPQLPRWLQPWSYRRRVDSSYRLPMPVFKIRGNVDPSWTLYQEGYPLAPGTEIRMMQWWDGDRNVSVLRPHILTMHPKYDNGWYVGGVWLKGRVVPCYFSATYRGWHHNHGLKPDVTHGDYMWNWPEASLTHA